MTIRTLHGIHTSPTSRRLRDMTGFIGTGAGTPTEYHEYGNLYAMQTRFCNPGIAERLSKVVAPGDILVGHSNGCCLWVRALLLGAPAIGLVLLNPALKDDFDFSQIPGLQFIHVYFNDEDGAVPWAQRSPHILTDPLWGDMGHDGFRGSDDRVTQYDCERVYGMPVLKGHSQIIDAGNHALWGTFIGRRIREELSAEDTWPRAA